MVDITLRSGGSALTHTQLDNNFSNLNQFSRDNSLNTLFYSGGFNGTGQRNVFIGAASNSIQSGNYNTALGVGAGDSLTTAEFTTCIGYNAGTPITDGSTGRSTIIGAYAGGAVNTGTGFQTLIGVDAGYTNFDSYATSIGYGASKYMEGLQHTSVGAYALQGSTSYSSADYNTAVGFGAAQYAYGYDYIAALGQYAGLEPGSYSTCVGSYAGANSNWAYYTTFIGWGAGRNCQASYNTSIGMQSGYYVTGQSNTFIGYNAGNSGSSSTYYSGAYNICIGRNSLPSSSTISNECSIGGPTTLAGTVISTFRIPGTGTTITSSLLAHGGDIAAYYSSDIRLKENIHVIPNALSKVNALRGVTYDWTDEALEMRKSPDLKWTQRKEDVGVIAQEVEKVLPELVLDRADGYKGIKYERLTALLIEAVKELSARVEELENGIS